MTTVLGAVAGAGKSNWTGSTDPTRLDGMDVQIKEAVKYLTMRNQIMQYLPEALRLLAAHKRSQQQQARPGYQDGMIVRSWTDLSRWQNALARMKALDPSHPDLAECQRRIDQYDGLQTQLDDVRAAGGDPARCQQIQAMLDDHVRKQADIVERVVAYLQQGRAAPSDLITRNGRTIDLARMRADLEADNRRLEALRRQVARERAGY
jgi:hypothetical protein